MFTNLFRRSKTAGAELPSYTSELLNRVMDDEKEENVVKWTAASLYAAGADTVCLIKTFLIVTVAVFKACLNLLIPPSLPPLIDGLSPVFVLPRNDALYRDAT